MVAARAAFLGAGHYAPVARAVGAAAREAAGPATAPGSSVVDLGAGPGHYLAGLLEALEGIRGIALDASRPALRRALRAHPRIAAVACDVWRELPLQNAAADLVLDIFAPRNGREIARVLSPGGSLIVVTPAPDHLHQLVRPLGMIGVDRDKQARLDAELSPHLTAVTHRLVRFDMTLGPRDVQALVAMGPSAHHLGADEVRRRLGGLPGELRVTASVRVATYRRP
jgi:23S rRNA (guanine745-N1)-methyltransferase